MKTIQSRDLHTDGMDSNPRKNELGMPHYVLNQTQLGDPSAEKPSLVSESAIKRITNETIVTTEKTPSPTNASRWNSF